MGQLPQDEEGFKIHIRTLLCRYAEAYLTCDYRQWTEKTVAEAPPDSSLSAPSRTTLAVGGGLVQSPDSRPHVLVDTARTIRHAAAALQLIPAYLIRRALPNKCKRAGLREGLFEKRAEGDKVGQSSFGRGS